MTSSRIVSSKLRKGICTHSTVDNNDGNQETLTGAGTTHDTNKTLFQLPTKEENESLPEIGYQVERQLDICDSVENEQTKAAP